eukprot:gnl/TRDRNA2_/TRDRNA2_181694_c0_seq1.p1 gnl/TRDRNA2_/TRDRNA2_181694_c0~~gnl/TRDRNA2_/TRDRNA2_181694_c0_seq1.p1  ORF type:complete len:191 (-),score=43.84 gnl/TRDRNA2_/TRDRNA2_181694_c0_seq1:100-672(-)
MAPVAMAASHPPLERPLTWEEVAAAVDQGNLDLLGGGRSAAQIDEYRSYKAEILKCWASVGDYMLVDVVGLLHDTRKDENGKKAAVMPEKLPNDLIWKHNPFNYFMEEGIEHHCIWSMRPLQAVDLEEVMYRERPDSEVLWFVNPPHLRSIPEVEHAHVITRQLPAGVELGKKETLAGELLRGRRLAAGR